MGLSDGDSSMKMVTSMTHIGTTIYFEIGYETRGDLCADEQTEEEKEMCEMTFGDMPAVQSYSMTTTTTHTEIIAAMAEETADDADMDPRFMLEFISYVECMGSFTPAGTVDGLQMFNVSMDMMDEDSSLTPQLALCMFDSDDSNTISFNEFLATDESDADDEETDELKTIFDESDLDANGELNNDELATFIEAMDSYEDDHSDHGDDHDDYDEMDGGEDSEMMPDMSVAFNNAGEIEYFSMNMEGTEMKMYVLTEDRVDSIFANVDSGTLVALPFSISDSMDDDDDWEDDSDDGYDSGIYWEQYDYCEWEGNGDSDTRWWCTDNDDSSDGFDDWWYYCEAYPSLGSWYCTDDFGQSAEYANSADSERYLENNDDGWDDNSGDSDEINSLDDFDVSSWDSTNDLQQIVDWFNNNYEYGEDEPMMTVEDFLNYCDADSDSVNNDVAECVFEYAMNTLGLEDNDADSDAPTASDLLSMTDTDENSAMTPEEFFTFLESDEGCCLPQEMKDDISELMNQNDADSSGDLDVNELEEFILDFINYEDSMEEDDDENGDHDGHDHGDDDGHDHGDDSGDEDDEIVMYITSEMDFHFEGDMSDYKIELASCDYDYDMETGEETSTCTTVMSVAINDAGMDSDIMFHDADSSGTVSVGDMIHIGETAESWDSVRLYSISADAYSDENPMHDAP
jgi:Ca2+-binding EF-hand superfamily protein